MTPAKLAEIESRLRDAYADAAATIRGDELRRYAPEHAAGGRRRIGRRRAILFVPLAAAAAVAVIAVAAVLIPSALHPRSGPLPAPDQDVSGPLPRYLLTIPNYPDTHFNVQNAVSGKVTANIPAPKHGEWWSLAAEGSQSFLAADLFTVKGCTSCSFGSETSFYLIVLNSRGKLARERQVGRTFPGIVSGLAVTPNGRYAAYLIGGNPPEFTVQLKNIVTGRLIASWPQHGAMPDSISIDAAGNAVAVSAYEYKPREDNSILQWTSVLRARTSGTTLIDEPKITAQDSALVLSPDGKIVYEFLQAGRVTDTSWRSKKPVTFDLAAVDAATGEVISVLHTWRAMWAGFNPQLALSPGGRYLLVVNARSLARIDLITGRYTALPGKINWFETTLDAGYPSSHDPSDGVIYVDPLAW